ncbi:MAG: AAA-like domain-containing protein [Lachnospiraceae bacterium]|nr:AAA-like domain-containing protein [Lachnospiraceae bacterium]
MGKRFNTTGICYPDEHYMVNLDSRLNELTRLIDQNEYFTINRARQYGKTTTINLLAERLSDQYSVFFISFEGISDDVYAAESSFCRRICGLLSNALFYGETNGISRSAAADCAGIADGSADANLFTLSNLISKLCMEAGKPVVLMIDEVDQAADQRIFLSFLGMLRDKYLKRKRQPTFCSVILASVYDIKNLKPKIRPDSAHQFNSPWNIASDFSVDMNFHVPDIAGMLAEYEQNAHTGMDIPLISAEIYEYTSGYPFLVSRICKIMDEILPRREAFPTKPSVWKIQGIREAVKILLLESNTLFDDMVKKLNDFPDLKKMLYAMLFRGEKFPWNSDTHIINIGLMFGFMDRVQDTVVISNRIFETRLYNLFLSEDLINSKIYKAASLDKNMFVQDGQLDMELVLKRFTDTFTELYGDSGETFLEENGRRFFLLYLKPIINGIGNYYIEARTRNMRRTDVIIDYRGRQYVCELKIWRGEEYNRRGEQQLIDYLQDYHLTEGYMISFNFNKKKKTGVRKIRIDGRMLVEAVV